MTWDDDQRTDERADTPMRTVRAVADRWRPYRRALSPADQFRLDQLFEYAEAHATAVDRIDHRGPLFATLLAIDLEQERRLDDLESRLDALEEDLNDGRP